MSENHKLGTPTVTKPMTEGPERQRSDRTRRPRFMRKTLIAITALIVIGAGVYFLAIYPRIQNYQALNAAAAAAGKKAVTVVEATQTSSAPDLVLPGNIQANQQTSIFGRVDGYIARWNTDIGAHVESGQVLADIDAPQIDAHLRMAQAQLELAEANLKLAQTNSVRSQLLFQNHVIAQQELDTVVATEQVQKATRDNAAAALKSAQDMKAFEQIRAPFAGTITARFIDVGFLVTSGSVTTVHTLFDLVQSDPVRVLVQVPQADISSVKSGTPATITVDQYPNETFVGKIARDAGAFDPTSRTLLLEIDVPNPDGRLFAGMYAHARFSLPSPTAALLIPNNPILISPQGPQILALNSPNHIHT